MTSLAQRVDALIADFGLSAGTPIPEVVSHVSQATSMQVEGKPLAEQVAILYEAIHGQAAENAASTAPPIAMGVPVDGEPSMDVQAQVGEVIRATPSTAAVAIAEPVAAPYSNSSTTVGRVIQETIRIGAPLFNRGDHRSCYRIYHQMASAIVARLDHGRQRALLLGALQQAAREAESGQTRRASWTLRHAFDELQGSDHRLIGFPDVRTYTTATNQADDGLGGRGSTLTPSGVTVVSTSSSSSSGVTVKAAISDAIDKGAPVYNRGNKAGCYYIYRRTAECMVERLDELSETRAKLEAAMALARTRAGDHGRPGGEDRAAWTMRHCFDALVAERADPVLAPGMPTARQIKAEVGFPGTSSAYSAAGSGCCSVS